MQPIPHETSVQYIVKYKETDHIRACVQELHDQVEEVAQPVHGFPSSFRDFVVAAFWLEITSDNVVDVDVFCRDGLAELVEIFVHLDGWKTYTHFFIRNYLDFELSKFLENWPISGLNIS